MDKLYAISLYSLISYTISPESVYGIVFEELQKVRVNELRRNMLRQSQDSCEYIIIGN